MFSDTAQKTCKNMEKLAFSRPLGGSLVRNAQPLRKLLRGRARNLLAQRSRNAVEQLLADPLVLPLHQPRPPLRGPATSRTTGPRGCFASNTDLELWTEEVEQGVIFQKPFPGAARTELESQLQRAVKVSAKGKRVKCKMDLERCLFWDPAGNRVPRPAEFALQGPRACGGPARVADGQAVGRVFGGAPPHAGTAGGAVLPVLGLQQL